MLRAGKYERIESTRRPAWPKHPSYLLRGVIVAVRNRGRASRETLSYGRYENRDSRRSYRRISISTVSKVLFGAIRSSRLPRYVPRLDEIIAARSRREKTNRRRDPFGRIRDANLLDSDSTEKKFDNSWNCATFDLGMLQNGPSE